MAITQQEVNDSVQKVVPVAHKLTRQDLEEVYQLRNDLHVSFTPFARDFLLDIIPEKMIEEVERNDKINRYGLGCELANMGNSYLSDINMMSNGKHIQGFSSDNYKLSIIIKEFECEDSYYSLNLDTTYPVKADDYYYAGGKKLAQDMMYYCATLFPRAHDYEMLFFLAKDLAKPLVEEEFNKELHLFLVAMCTNNEKEAKIHLQHARAIMVVRNTAVDCWNRYYTKSLFKNVIGHNLLEYLLPVNESYFYKYGVLSEEERLIQKEFMDIQYELHSFCNSLSLEAYQYLFTKDKENLATVISLETKEAKDFIKDMYPRIFNLNWKISFVLS